MTTLAAHPEDLLRDFRERFDVLHELAYAVRRGLVFPVAMDETFANGITALHGDFHEVEVGVKEWCARQEARREGEKETEVAQ